MTGVQTCALPILDAYNITGKKYIRLYQDKAGIFNYRIAKTHTEIIVTGSIINSLLIYQAGFENTIPLYEKEVTDEYLKLFKDFCTSKIYLCLGSDKYINKKMAHTISALDINVQIVNSPRGYTMSEY